MFDYDNNSYGSYALFNLTMLRVYFFNLLLPLVMVDNFFILYAPLMYMFNKVNLPLKF